MRSFKGLATRLFGGAIEKNIESFAFVKTGLQMADIKLPTRTYVSMIALGAVIATIAGLIAIQIIIQLLAPDTILPIRMVYSIFIPVAIGGSTFFMGLLYPVQKAGSRKKDIESNLPFVLTHMGAIAESGVPPYVIFRLVSQFKEYGEVAKEMGKIMRNIETFGLNPLKAVKEVAERTPSETFKQTLLGFVTTTESGGDLKSFLKVNGQQALFEWRIKREKFLQQLSAYAEFYTGILIAAPLFLIALFAIMKLIQPNIAGFDILFLTQLSIYVLIPVINGVFLMFLRGVEVEI